MTKITTLKEARKAIRTPGTRVTLWVEVLRTRVSISKSDALAALDATWNPQTGEFQGGTDHDLDIPIYFDGNDVDIG